MSVLIKGMEMPTSCDKCPLLYVTSICDGSKDCPLLPVPPHGRLGDLDALLKKCEFVCTDDDEDTRAVRYSIIEEAATIIPAEEGE